MNQDVPGNPPPAAPPPPPPGQPFAPPAPPAPLSPSDERTWAMVAHLSVLLNLVTGFLGVVAALVIYIIFKDRSRYVGYQAMQSFVFQLILWIGAGLAIGAIWAVTGALSAILIGVLCVPFSLLFTVALGLLPVIALIYGIYAGLESNQGKDFRYWLVGDWVKKIVPG